MAEQPEDRVLVHITTVPSTLIFLAGSIRQVKSQGFTVHAVSSPGPRLDHFAHELSIVTHAVNMPRRITPLGDLLVVGQISGTLRRLRPDIVHGHTPKGGLLGMISAWLCRTPVCVYTMHGLPHLTATGLKRRLLRWTERMSCRLAHRVLCVSASIRQIAIDERICEPEKIRVLASGSIDGVDAEQVFNPDRFTTVDRNSARERYGIPAESIAIGFVGRIVRDKGFVELASAWRRLRAEFSSVHLLIVGPFEPQDPVPPEVEKLLREDQRIHLAGETWDTPPQYAAMDLVAIPTYREGFSVVCLEASAMALPVVGTRVPGCADAITDGVTGTLVPVRDADALTEALRTYLLDADLRRRHGLAGRERALRNYSPQIIREALHQEYLELLAVRTAKAPWKQG